MKFVLDIDIQQPLQKIRHQDKILLVGSCFTEHIGNRLAALKFSTLQNPNGILFDAHSVGSSLLSYIDNKPATMDDLFFFNELWQSWQHHSVFSGLQPQLVLDNINQARQQAHAFLATCDWLIITLGTSYAYRLVQTGGPIANCHRAPSRWFEKHLLEITNMQTSLAACMEALQQFNKKLKVIFTVSPVRHVRDGVVNNNRSKARLIETVHHLVNAFNRVYYFPAYELVIDVLRDYRFYDIDLVHPNYAATDFVFNQFTGHYIDPGIANVLEEIKKISTAFHHKPQHASTAAHQQFREHTLARIHLLQQSHPYLDLGKELAYFGGKKAGAETNQAVTNPYSFLSISSSFSSRMSWFRARLRFCSG